MATGRTSATAPGRDAVLLGHRHLAAVFRRVRAHRPPVQPAGGRGRHRARGAPGVAADLPPLGRARLGDLCAGRPGRRLLRLPPQAAAGAALGALPAVRRAPDEGLGGQRGGLLRHLRHPAGPGDQPRHRLAAGLLGPGVPVRLSAQPGRAADGDPGDERGGDAGRRVGDREGHPPPVEPQHHPVQRPAAVRAAGRRHPAPAQWAGAEPRRLPQRPGAEDLRSLRLHRPVRQERGVDGPVDPVLLGLVDFLGALRRHVHRPHLPWAHGARAGVRRAADPARLHPWPGCRSSATAHWTW